MLFSGFGQRTLLLALASVASWPCMANNDEGDVRSFNEAYLAYEKAAESAAYGEAVLHAENALKEGLAVFGKQSEEVRMLTFNHGVMLSLSGNDEDAYEVLEVTLERTQELHGKNASQVVPIYTQLERIAGNLGKTRDQRAFAKREVDLTARDFGRRSRELADAAHRAGHAYQDDNPGQARKYYERAYGASTAKSDPDGEIRQHSAADLGSIAYARDDLDEAEKWLLAALQAPDPTPNEMSDAEFRARRLLVGVFERTGRPELATEHCVAVGRFRPATEPNALQLLYTGEGPMYPERAVDQDRDGTVVMIFTVDAEGYVRDPELLSGSRTGDFGRFMLRRVLEFRFAPRMLDGQPVPVEGFEFTVNFGLE